ncbi:hypothetical protein AMECASPLE_018979 [Ameca splendens]|uniref:Uncharacterized protein n=1 Tax=Ameca splendens TaxID=208324 RepID=A0ABV1ACG5_9TELE
MQTAPNFMEWVTMTEQLNLSLRSPSTMQSVECINAFTKIAWIKVLWREEYGVGLFFRSSTRPLSSSKRNSMLQFTKTCRTTRYSQLCGSSLRMSPSCANRIGPKDMDK